MSFVRGVGLEVCCVTVQDPDPDPRYCTTNSTAGPGTPLREELSADVHPNINMISSIKPAPKHG